MRGVILALFPTRRAHYCVLPTPFPVKHHPSIFGSLGAPSTQALAAEGG